MEWFSALWLRVRTLLRRRQLERDLRDEIAFHVEMRAEDLRRKGMPDAPASARRQFGNVTRIQDDCRSAWSFVSIERLLRDFRYAARSLAKKPGFTVVAVLTLAIGIGANAAVFSAIDAILLRPLPFPDGDQLMSISQFRAKDNNKSFPLAPVRLSEWDGMNSTLQSISGYYTEDISESSAEIPEKLTRAWVAPRFFQTWAISPALGRTFVAEEERYHGRSAVVISDRFWRRRFAADPSAVGKQLRVEKISFTIVGIMPARFEFANRDVDLWSPSAMDAPFAQSREATWFNTIGRLKPGVTREQAFADLSSIQLRLGQQFPKTDSDITVLMEPLKEITVAESKRSLWILFGSVTVLLLIACTNIAALFLARSADREQEIVIRLSLGASRASVLFRLLAEVFLIAIVGAAFGLMLAASTSGVFHALAKNLPRVDEIHLNWTLVVYTLACAVGATLLCGLLPALRSIRRCASESMTHAGRSIVSGRGRLQWTLVGIQIALSVTLLVGSGLLLRSMEQLGRVSPGFDPEKVLTFRVSANWAETTDLKLLWRRTNRVLDSLRTLPGVRSAATALVIPGVVFHHPEEVRIVEGGADPNRRITAASRIVSNGYFETLGIPLLAGESCREDEAAMATALVNRSFVDTYLAGSARVGQHIETVPRNSYVPQAEILGVVADVREEGLNRAPSPMVYWCNSAAIPSPLFLLRTSGDPMAMAATVRARIHEIEPARSVYDVTPLRDHLSDTLAENRLRTILLTFFAATAIALTCLGIYGTLAYLVNIRRREIGLRLALGALRSEIVSHFVSMGLRVCIIGSLAGLGLAIALTRSLSQMLYGVSPLDPLTFAAVLALVLVTGAVASLIPAIRAARVGPMQVLRED